MLARELAAFQVKVSTSAAEEMGAWREGAHDDLVLAVAVAMWLGEHCLRRLGAEHFFVERLVHELAWLRRRVRQNVAQLADGKALQGGDLVEDVQFHRLLLSLAGGTVNPYGH
jgi:hypothetical protein